MNDTLELDTPKTIIKKIPQQAIDDAIALSFTFSVNRSTYFFAVVPPADNTNSWAYYSYKPGAAFNVPTYKGDLTAANNWTQISAASFSFDATTNYGTALVYLVSPAAIKPTSFSSLLRPQGATVTSINSYIALAGYTANLWLFSFTSPPQSTQDHGSFKLCALMPLSEPTTFLTIGTTSGSTIQQLPASDNYYLAVLPGLNGQNTSWQWYIGAASNGPWEPTTAGTTGINITNPSTGNPTLNIYLHPDATEFADFYSLLAPIIQPPIGNGTNYAVQANPQLDSSNTFWTLVLNNTSAGPLTNNSVQMQVKAQITETDPTITVSGRGG